MMMMLNCFVLWLTDETRLSLFPAGAIVRIVTITNLWHAASRIWTCSEPEFRLCWMKLCSSDNHYTAGKTLLEELIFVAYIFVNWWLFKYDFCRNYPCECNIKTKLHRKWKIIINLRSRFLKNMVVFWQF